jgi:hypothetical protein
MRIRSIKPEFWTSEDIAALDWPTRLLFIGLWSYVDDNGVGRDNDKLIKADLFPLEDDPRDTLATVSRGLQALSDGGQITRYEVDGKPYLYINAWEDHQRIDRPNKPRYPLPTCDDAVIRDTLATPSRDTRESVATGTGEQRSRGTEEKSVAHPRNETDPAFDEFWNTYDRKVGRKPAQAAWKTALRKPGVTPQLLIASAAAYIDWQRSEGKHPEFTKHPTTWLNGEHWRDERPARTAARSRVSEHLDLARQLAAQDPTLPQIGA